MWQYSCFKFWHATHTQTRHLSLELCRNQQSLFHLSIGLIDVSLYFDFIIFLNPCLCIKFLIPAATREALLQRRLDKWMHSSNSVKQLTGWLEIEGDWKGLFILQDEAHLLIWFTAEESSFPWRSSKPVGIFKKNLNHCYCTCVWTQLNKPAGALW